MKRMCWLSAMAALVTLGVFAGGRAQPANVSAAAQAPSIAGGTCVTIRDGKWFINGRLSCAGSPAEGLLMNVRMVNAVFEDRSDPKFNADENTDEFLKQIDAYYQYGVRAFTIGLQGGNPGYEGALNSAFNSDGSLRSSYMARVERVIEACDRQGIAVILSCYYQRQSAILADAAAIRAGVAAVADWIRQREWSNVLLEVANEYPHRGFAHDYIRSPAGQVELIRIAKRRAPALLVSTSGYGDGRLDDEVARAADFLLIHFNGTPIRAIADRVQALRRYAKPIVCNEDAKTAQEGAQAAETCVRLGVSWGLMDERKNQHAPFVFRGAADDPAVYAAFRRLTRPSQPGRR